MFSHFRHLLRRSPKSARRPVRASLELVKLEDRDTPAMFAGTVHLNTLVPLNQYDVSSATNPAGARVAVWTHDATAANQDIRGQRYTRFGAKIGPEFSVVATSVDETQADVAIDASGRFYVAFVRQTTPVNRDIFVRRYSPAGALLGTTAVANDVRNEYDPHISVSPGTGSFVVSYTRDFTPVDQDILAKMYNAVGGLTRTIAVANSPAIDETNSDVARSQSLAGNTPFGVVYTINNRDVFLRRYDAVGNLLGVSAIAVSNNFENNPSVSANALGNYGVAWQAFVGGNWNVYARVVSSAGATTGVGLVFVSALNETDPSIAIKNDNDFVVAFQYRTPAASFVYVTEMNFVVAAPTRRAIYFVAGPTATSITRPSVAIDFSGYYTIAYALFNGPADPAHGLFGRLGNLV